MDAAVSLKKKRMRDEGFSENEIASVMRAATRRPQLLEKVVEDAEEKELSEFNQAKTTFDMNNAAARHFEKLDLEMRHAYERAEVVLEGEQLERFQKAQEAWAQYRDLTGDIYSEMEGSMWPSVGLMVRAKITKRRAEDLKDDLAAFKGEPS
jgi:uncharacterized protein YecT (DUF1311 family)